MWYDYSNKKITCIFVYEMKSTTNFSIFHFYNYTFKNFNYFSNSLDNLLFLNEKIIWSHFQLEHNRNDKKINFILSIKSNFYKLTYNSIYVLILYFPAIFFLLLLPHHLSNQPPPSIMVAAVPPWLSIHGKSPQKCSKQLKMN